jgi:hypothetical protein
MLILFRCFVIPQQPQEKKVSRTEDCAKFPSPRKSTEAGQALNDEIKQFFNPINLTIQVGLKYLLICKSFLATPLCVAELYHAFIPVSAAMFQR